MNWKTKKYFLPLCTAAFTTVAAGGGALADIINLTPGDFAASSGIAAIGSQEVSDTLTFDKFDGGLGTLTGVSMGISYDALATLTVIGSEGGQGNSTHEGEVSFALQGVADHNLFSLDLDAFYTIDGCIDDGISDATGANFSPCSA